MEVDQHGGDEDEPGRDWEVHLRRGSRVVVVQRGLGRFSAIALAADLRTIVGGGQAVEAS